MIHKEQNIEDYHVVGKTIKRIAIGFVTVMALGVVLVMCLV
jgi:hypothetical protein